MSEWTLRGTTELSATRWPDLPSQFAGWRAAWADLDGMHVDVPLPSELPVTTHLWGWTSGGWLRVRVDGNRWWGGVLFHGDPIDSALWRAQPTPVEVRIDRIRSWATAQSKVDGRVQQMRIASGTVPPTMVQLTPVSARTAAYIGAPDTIASST